MTTSVKVTACCMPNIEILVTLNGELLDVLQDRESREFLVYDDREISVKESLKVVEEKP